MIGIGISIASGHPVVSPGGGGPSSAVVSGAGTAAANGTYTYRGMSGGKPYYNKEGEADSATLNAVVYDGAWFIDGSSGEDLYDDLGAGGAEYPWQVAVWVTTDGDAPAPTVTEG